MSPEVWRFLRRPQHRIGTKITTGLLGPVAHERKDSHRGHIPDGLQNEANEHGFRIIYADWRNNLYTLQVIR